jgi:multiple sugar transport system permease protein
MGIWGSFLWPLVVTNAPELRTLPLGLMAFRGQYGIEWNLMMAAALLMLLPVVVLFILGQRFFISGLTTGAVKG